MIALRGFQLIYRRPFYTSYASWKFAPSVIQSQQFRSALNFAPVFHCSLETKRTAVNEKAWTSNIFIQHDRSFHTTRRNQVPLPPLIALLVTKGLQVAAVITGRQFRKKMANHEHAHTIRYYIICVLPLLAFIYAFGTYLYHRETTPITGRKRYVAYTNEQFKSITEIELQALIQNQKVLDTKSEGYVTVERIVRRLIAGNLDMEFFRNQNWTIRILDTDEKNACVLPSGDIIVNKGMIKLTENDDQLATVLAHELSHAFLRHGAEKHSINSWAEGIAVFILLGVWALMPSDLSAGLMHWIYNRFAEFVLHLPYSRMLEEEADQVGLHLMAKACYDVREASNVWRIMEIGSILVGDGPVPKYFSTHPPNLNRIERLDQLTSKEKETRLQCGCPRLCPVDPRSRWNELLEKALSNREQLAPKPTANEDHALKINAAEVRSNVRQTSEARNDRK